MFLIVINAIAKIQARKINDPNAAYRHPIYTITKVIIEDTATLPKSAIAVKSPRTLPLSDLSELCAIIEKEMGWNSANPIPAMINAGITKTKLGDIEVRK